MPGPGDRVWTLRVPSRCRSIGQGLLIDASMVLDELLGTLTKSERRESSSIPHSNKYVGGPEDSIHGIVQAMKEAFVVFVVMKEFGL